MKLQSKPNWFRIGAIVLILLALPWIGLTFGNHNAESVRRKIKDYLHEKYGKEFVVKRIGVRSSRGEEFYQARIYPKSIIGTNKEGDSYYYASATVGKLSFGRLGEVGDSYSYVMMNKTGEEYLMPQAKEIFGERVLLKVKSELEIWGREDIIVEEYKENGAKVDGVDTFIGYKESDFEKARKRVVNDPEHNRLKLDLDIYIFDRIEDEAEKEKRRKQIFNFVQYLKEEKLFKYLEMRVVIVDERVLAPSYNDFKWEIRRSDKVEKRIEEENETVKLPPMKLRKKISKQLQKEIEKMNEKELLESMRKIKKYELDYDGIGKWNSQYRSLIYSEGMIKERYPSSYEEDAEAVRDYKSINDVKIGTYLNYIYVN